jgi:hypothetical protein
MYKREKEREKDREKVRERERGTYAAVVAAAVARWMDEIGSKMWHGAPLSGRLLQSSPMQRCTMQYNSQILTIKSAPFS